MVFLVTVVFLETVKFAMNEVIVMMMGIIVFVMITCIIGHLRSVQFGTTGGSFLIQATGVILAQWTSTVVGLAHAQVMVCLVIASSSLIVTRGIDASTGIMYLPDNPPYNPLTNHQESPPNNRLVCRLVNQLINPLQNHPNNRQVNLRVSRLVNLPLARVENQAGSPARFLLDSLPVARAENQPVSPAEFLLDSLLVFQVLIRQ